MELILGLLAIVSVLILVLLISLFIYMYRYFRDVPKHIESIAQALLIISIEALKKDDNKT